MALSNFQQALSNLVMSPMFSNEVRSQPEHALLPYNLTYKEYKRLVQLANDPGLKIGRLIHRSFRVSILANTLPKTCMILGKEQLGQLVHAFWEIQPPTDYYYQKGANLFAVFLLSRIAEGKSNNSFLKEVLHLELAQLLLAATQSVTKSDAPDLEWLVKDSEHCFPCLNANHRLVFFRYSPKAIFAALESGNLSIHLSDDPQFVLLERLPSNYVEYKIVSESLGILLNACDGTKNVSKLCCELSITADGLQRLIELGFLTFRHVINTG